MKIVDLILSAGRTGFYFDDQKAIKAGATGDGNFYRGAVATPGFSQIRQPGESISVLLLLDDGEVAWGDATAVQYSGAAGRDPLFLARDFIPVIEERVAPALIGQELDDLDRLCRLVEGLQDGEGRRLHTAIRYGVTQALLDAVARSQRKLMCEVVADRYGSQVSERAIPIFTQSGDNRYDAADKMIIKQVDVLPHALINHVDSKLGRDGGLLRDYLVWLSRRIREVRPDERYRPYLQIDVYGTIGQAFGPRNVAAIVDYLESLVVAADPFRLRIEGPVDTEERASQLEAMAELTAEVDRRDLDLEIVADEWCNTLQDVKDFADRRAGHMIQVKTPDLGSIHNTVEAILYCKQQGVGAYLGGTCNETDRSAQISAHLAMATRADQILAKPGMGVDEGFMIVYNEMQRILALRRRGK